jgi:hypothetical protein
LLARACTCCLAFRYFCSKKLSHLRSMAM